MKSVFAVLGVAILSSCGTSSRQWCPLTKSDMELLMHVLQVSQQTLNAADVVRVWPRPLGTVDVPGQGCVGPIVLSSSPFCVTCCDTVVFERMSSSGGGCTENFGSVTLLRRTHRSITPDALAAQVQPILREVAVASSPTIGRHGFTQTIHANAAETITLRVDLESQGDHQLARIIIYRTVFSQTDGRPTAASREAEVQ